MIEIGKKEGSFRLGMGPNTGPCGILEKTLNTPVKSLILKTTQCRIKNVFERAF